MLFGGLFEDIYQKNMKTNKASQGDVCSARDPLHGHVYFEMGSRGPFGGPLKIFEKMIKKQLKSLKIATLAVRKYSRSTQNEKLTLDKSSKYDLDSKNAIL